MIRVGILGAIGSGKSFIAKLFKYPVFNADKEVDIIYRNNKACFSKLQKKLPNYIKSFPIKKKWTNKCYIIKQKKFKINIFCGSPNCEKKNEKIFGREG